MRNIVKSNRILWTLAIGAVMTTAIAQRDNRNGNSGPSNPPQHTESPRSNNSAPVNYVPRASNPVQATRNDPPRSNNSAPVNYIPRASNPVQSPRNDAPRTNNSAPVNYVPRTTGAGQTSQSDTPHSNNAVLFNYVPRANSSSSASYHRGDPQQGGQGQGQGQDPRHGNQGQSGQDRGRDRGNDQSGHNGQDHRNDTRDSKPYWSPPPRMSVSDFRASQINGLRDAHKVYGDHARRGYWGYDNDFRESSFRFPFYVFDPYDTFGLVSPWYFYPSLPGYISPYRCTFLSAGFLPPLFIGLEYNCWRHNNNNAAFQQGYDQGYADAQQATQQSQQDSQVPDNRILDGALDDITAIFLHDDQRALDRLVGDNGNVNIYVDGRYSYSLATNDFYELIRDNAHTTKTVDYQILDVKVQGDTAKVIALHTFKDPWGDEEKVYHTYTLKVGRRSAQITEYGTSATRP